MLIAYLSQVCNFFFGNLEKRQERNFIHALLTEDIVILFSNLS